MKWIKYQYEERQLHLETLLEKINFNQLSDEFKMHSVLNDSIQLQNTKIFDKIANIYKKNLQNTLKTELNIHGNIIFLEL